MSFRQLFMRNEVHVVGIMVSVPLVIAIKTTSELYQQRHEHSTFNQAMKTEIDDTPST